MARKTKFKTRSEEIATCCRCGVAKGLSEEKVFRKRNEPYGKAVKIMHEKSGFERLRLPQFRVQHDKKTPG